MTIMVHASGIRGYLEVMQDLNFDPQHILAQYNITTDQIKQDDAWLDQKSVINLYECTADLAQCPDLGLRISKHQDISILGILGLIMQSASSMRGVIDYTSDFLFLHGPGLAISLNEQSQLFEETAEVIFEIRINGYVPQRQTIDNCLGTTHRILKWLAAENYELKAVSLPHMPLVSTTEYQRFFGAPILINQDRAALHLSRKTLESQPHSTNPALREIAEDYIHRYFRNPSEQVSASVRKALRLHLSTPRANKIHVATMLALHPRTLQRKLAQEGTSFDAIKDGIRKELALQYLWQTEISMSQLTDILGFSEQSAFSRACKRWFGFSPKEVRDSSDRDILNKTFKEE
jgi:AraC-like DNA-binding protein